MKDSDYLNLIKKHLTGEITSIEDKQLIQWLQQSEVHRQIFQEIQSIWINAGRQDREVSDQEVEREFRKLRGRLGMDK